MEHVWKFQEFCNSMTRLETDSYEYAYLKAIVLFSPGGCVFYKLSYHCEFLYLKIIRNKQLKCFCHIFNATDHPGVDGSGQIEKFQEKALMELQDYVQKTYPDDTYRYFHTIFPYIVVLMKSQQIKNVIFSIKS